MAVGEYSLNVPIGNYNVKAIKSNYNVEAFEVEVLEGQTTEKNFQLGRGGNMGAHLFFANMECNSLDEGWLGKDENNGTIATSNEQAKTGTYSLKSNITVAAGHGSIKSYTLEYQHSELYYRFYYYLPTATYNALETPNDLMVVIDMINIDFGSVLFFRIIHLAGTIKLEYNYGPGSDTCVCPSRDAWHCIEIYHKRDAVAGAWEWWVDGVSEGNGSGINTGAKNVYHTKWGIVSSVGMTGAIYIDNIVVSTARIYELMGNIPQGNALTNRKESPQGWVI